MGMHGTPVCSTRGGMCQVQAKEGEVMGHCSHQHAASKQGKAGLPAEQLDKPEDTAASDQVGQRAFQA